MPEKVRVENLSRDRYITEGYNRDGKLLVTRFRVESKDDIEHLKDIGVKICYLDNGSETSSNEAEDDESGDNIQNDTLSPEEFLNEHLNDISNFVEKTEETYEATLQKTQDLFDSIHTGQQPPEELRQLQPFIQKFMEFMDESPASISVLTQIKQFDKTTFDHSINVAILSLVYGNFMGFEKEKIFNLGFGALVHDIGKTKVSRTIIQKSRDLTEKEMRIVRHHPAEGRSILEDGKFNETIVRIAHEHHEKPDGSGYPESKTDIDYLALVVSVIDAYEALTAQRPYRSPMNPLRAYQVMKNEFNSYEETRKILQSLLQCMGLFPVGSIVKLTNGDLAVVVDNHPSSLKHPRVKVVKIPGEGRLDNPYQVDLDHVRNQKQVIDGRVYNDDIEIDQVFEFSKIPELRNAVPEIVQAAS
jgi:putative nucleotidyltransferase with HDIG domain